MNFTYVPWPNKLGYDHRYPDGSEWEFLGPTGQHQWRARFFSPGERVPSLFGEGDTAEKARENAVPIDFDDAPPCDAASRMDANCVCILPVGHGGHHVARRGWGFEA